MIEHMEDELTGAPKETSNNDDVDLAEVENVDESITAEAKDSNEIVNYLKEERNPNHIKIQCAFILAIVKQLKR